MYDKIIKWAGIKPRRESSWACLDLLTARPALLEKGAVFVYRPTTLCQYYYGVIVGVHRYRFTLHNKLHLQFFDYSTKTIHRQPDLSKAPLLFPPIVVNDMREEKQLKFQQSSDLFRSGWSDDCFEIVGKTDLNSLESVRRAMFVDLSGLLYNDAGEAVEYDQLHQQDAYSFLGKHGPCNQKNVEDFICHALHLPLGRDYSIGDTPLWYIDSFKEKLSEVSERRQKSVEVSSGKLIPLQTSYHSAAVTRTLNEEQKKIDWVRYVRQSGSEHFAIIQYSIEPASGETAILFKNEAVISASYRESTHWQRMFQLYVYFTAEGICDSADYRFKEDGIAIGGIQITLLQLEFHESDSRYMDYKIAGSMLLKNCFF